MKIASFSFYGLGAYRKKIELTFPNDLILLEGKNGSGKSSILESLAWTLFDETVSEGKKSEWVNDFTEVGEGNIVLVSSEGDTFTIIRKRTKKGSLELRVFHGDKEIITRSSAELQLFIENEILGCNFDIFRNSVMFGQEDVLKLAKGTDLEKKKIVGSILGFEEIEEILKQCRLTISEKRNKLEIINTRINEKINICGDESIDSFKEEEEKLSGELSFYDNSLKELNEEKKMLMDSSLISSILEKRHLIERINSLQVSYKEVNSQLKKAYISVTAFDSKDYVEKEKNIIENRLREIQKLINKTEVSIENFQTYIQKLSNLKGVKVCPTCLQPLKEEYGEKLIKDWKEGIVAEEAKIKGINPEKEELATQYNDFQKQLQSLSSLETEIMSLEKATNNYSKEIEDIDFKLKELEKVDEAIDISQDEIKRKRIQEDEKIINSDSVLIRTQLAVLDATKKAFVKTQEELISLKKEQAIFQKEIIHLEYLENLFSIKGIRNDMLVNFLPILEKYLEEYASILLPNFAISTSTVREGKTGVVKVGLDFDIQDITEGMVRPFKLFSGGQKKLISICLRLALWKVSTLFNKKALNILFLDEIFSCLDPENRENTFIFLRQLQNTENCPIVVIEHLPEIKERFDTVWRVSYEISTGSDVEI
ncbi:MAG: AAA family ATPase [Clostridia bacterium]|jgi:DNA repair exonuclease SbcCD ATPase subunit